MRACGAEIHDAKSPAQECRLRKHGNDSVSMRGRGDALLAAAPKSFKIHAGTVKATAGNLWPPTILATGS